MLLTLQPNQPDSPNPADFLSPPDFARLRLELEAARARGDAFDGAWKFALHAAAPALDARAAAKATRSAWKRAYELEPATAGERAVAGLIGALDRSLTLAA